MTDNKYLFNMNCPKCNAGLELDIDHLMSFCPYCGDKLLVDPVAFREVLVEKEKTRRVGMQYAQEDKEREEANRRRAGRVKTSIIMAIIGMAMCIIGVFVGNATHNTSWGLVGTLGFLLLIAIPYVWFLGEASEKKRR